MAANGSGPSPGSGTGAALLCQPLRSGGVHENTASGIMDSMDPGGSGQRRIVGVASENTGSTGRLGMLTLQIADQSVTDPAARVETRWAIYPRDPNHAAHGVGDLQDPSR